MSDKVVQLLAAIAAAELSMDEIKLLAAGILERIPQGRYGRILLYELRRLVPSMSFEGVLLRGPKDQAEVFMVERPAGETYEGQLCVPGTTFEAGEDDKLIAARLCRSKFGFPAAVGYSFIFVEPYFSRVEQTSIGGTYIGMVYLIEASVEPAAPGAWYPVNDLPENTIYTHKEMIRLAHKAY